MEGARSRLLRDPVPRAIISFTPASDALIDSSLSFMIDLFASKLDVPICHRFDLEGGVDVEGAAVDAARSRQSDEAVLIAGTSFAFVHLIDAAGDRDLRFAPSTRVMLTGGFKGRSREVSEPELRSGLERVFGVKAEDVIGEYGMTELSSQMYEESGVYVAPHWVKIDAVDELTLAVRPAGEVGLCRVVDLANVDSSIAILTADRIRHEDNGFRLLGRAPGATPRGCSLLIEDLLADAR
jgi:hypothetical protein